MNLNNKRKYLPAAIVLGILLICLVILYYQTSHSPSGVTAMIYQDNKLLHQVDLTQVKEPYEFIIEYPQGGYNKIRVEKGQIGIIDANCPDKICQRMGMVQSDAYPISCLPHKLLIKIISADPGSDQLDAVVG